MVKAYKCFKNDLSDANGKYEIGKTYHVDILPYLKYNSAFAHTSPDDTMSQALDHGFDCIYKVELFGDEIIYKNKKSGVVAESFKIVKEVDYMTKSVNADYYYEPRYIAFAITRGQVTVDDILKDKPLLKQNPTIQKAIAKQNIEKYNDILAEQTDINYSVMQALIETRNEKYINKWFNSGNDYALYCIAKLNIKKYNDILINSDNWRILEAIAESTDNVEYLTKLSNHSQINVRFAVIKTACKLNLTSLLDKFVTSQYKADRSTLAQYTTDKKYLDILVTDEDPLVRAIVAEKGIEKYLDILINDDSNVVLNHIIATGNQKYIDEIIKKDIFKEDSYLRANIASLGIDKYCQMLINDKSKVVRRAIISLGIKKYLDIYVNSDNTFDREEVAEVASTNNYTEYLDKLVYDSHCMVRKLVAESGNPKYLDILVNDEDASVRANVARIAGLTNQVKYLDILSKDKSRDVRDAVLYYADDDY